MRQRREILGKQFVGARQPQSFGSLSGGPPSPQPSDSVRGQSPGSSPATASATATISARRTLFEGGAAAPAPSAPPVQQAQPGGGSPAAGLSQVGLRNGEGPQSALGDRRMLGDGLLAESVQTASGLGLSRANGEASPEDTAVGAPAAKARRRPWLSQPGQ